MSYQVLARKWRPRFFDEMVGQEHVLRALINALNGGRLHHAYLFTGTRGVGKTTIARILAKCLNCEEGVSARPCGVCSSCREIAEGRFVDLIEVDAASRTRVEDTRELLDNVQYAPTRGRYKVYLIDEVHMLSTHSFNALLKTLEEPPEHVKFLLATTDPQKLPVTILSRCLQFSLKNMTPERIVEYLQHVLGAEEINYQEGALWALGRAAQGSMRDALSLTDQAIAYGEGNVTEEQVNAMLGTMDRGRLFKLAEIMAQGNANQIMAEVADMADHSPDYGEVLQGLLATWHKVALGQVVPDAVDNAEGDRKAILQLATAMSAEDVQLYYQIGLQGRRDLELAASPRQGFEMVLLRMLAFRPAPSQVPDLDLVSSLEKKNTNLAGSYPGSGVALSNETAVTDNVAMDTVAMDPLTTDTVSIDVAAAEKTALAPQALPEAQNLPETQNLPEAQPLTETAMADSVSHVDDDVSPSQFEPSAILGSTDESREGDPFDAHVASTSPTEDLNEEMLEAPVGDQSGSIAVQQAEQQPALAVAPCESSLSAAPLAPLPLQEQPAQHEQPSALALLATAGGDDNEPVQSRPMQSLVDPDAAKVGTYGTSAQSCADSTPEIAPEISQGTVAQGSSDTAVAGGLENAEANQSSTELSTLTPANWYQWVEKLQLGGLPLAIAKNSALISIEGDNLYFDVDPAQGALFNESQSQRIERSLAQLLPNCRLTMTLQPTRAETPEQRRQRLASEALYAARQAIESDSQIATIVNDFGGYVIDDSIRPIQ